MPVWKRQMRETGKNAVVSKNWDGEEGRLCEKQWLFFFFFFSFKAVKLFCIIL